MYASPAPPNHSGPGWAAGASTPTDSAPAESEIYHVLFAPDDIREITLEQLDDCFRLGVIDESTRVWTEGMQGWQTLGEAAGLERPEPELAPPSGARRRTPPPRRRPQAATAQPSAAAQTPLALPQGGPVWSRGSVQSAPQASVSYPHAAPAMQPSASFPMQPSAPHQLPDQMNDAHWNVPGADQTWQSQQAQAEAVWLQQAQAQQAQAEAAWLQQAQAQQAQAEAAQWSAAVAPSWQPPPVHSRRQSLDRYATTSPPAAGHSWQVPHAQTAHTQTPVAGLQYQQFAAPYQPALPVQSAFPAAYPVQAAGATLAPMASEAFDSTVFTKRTGKLGGRLQSAFLWGCLLSGAIVTLYRNDVLLAGAKHLNQEAAFLELEKKWLGGAPSGTPRQVRVLTNRATATTSSATGGDTAASGNAAIGGNVATDSVIRLPAFRGEASPGGKPSGAIAADTSAKAAETSPAELPTADVSGTRARPSGDARSSTQRTVVSSGTETRAKPRPAARPQPKPTRSAPRERDEPVASAPTPAGGDDFLRMSMRNAVKNAKAKKRDKAARQQEKKSAGASSYDPLNGDL